MTDVIFMTVSAGFGIMGAIAVLMMIWEWACIKIEKKTGKSLEELLKDWESAK